MSASPHITLLSPRAVRISYAADRPWLAHVLLPQPEISPADAQMRIEAERGVIRAFSLDGREFFCQTHPPDVAVRGRRVVLDVDVPKTRVGLEVRRLERGIRLRLAAQTGEIFYGWGERFDSFARRGGEVRALIRDAIAMLQPGGATYSALPFFLSSRGYGLLLLNSHPACWKLEPQAGRITIEADGPGADYILIYGPTFKEILTTYTALTGRPPLPPMWAFGLWVTTYPQGPQETVLEHVRQHRERKIPLDAVILDYHWEERFHNFQWRKSLFPDPAGLIAALHAENVRLGLILTPFVNHRRRPFQKWLLNRLAHNVPAGMAGDDERALPEYAEGLAKGYFAHPDAPWWFGAGGMVDFTNPAAAEWWNARLRALYAQGVDFVKNDDGEYLPANATSALGMDGREYHNLYGFFYAKALYEGHQQSHAPQRGLIYARSAWVGSQRYPALFLGDQKPTFEFIRRTLNAALNMSLAGFAYWTADVFGLDGKTSPETHLRYAQWALLAPIARYFYRPSEVDDTRFPWSHGAENEANFRKYAELRYRLLPYWYALAWEAYRTGIPPVRPMLLEFTDQRQLAETADQYMLGDRLLAAPVIEAGATSRKVSLPPGTWYDFWTEARWEGPAEIEYPASLDCLPLLVRGGTLLILGPALSSIPQGHRFEQLELHLWPGKDMPGLTEWVLYEDDGQTTAYQHGEYALTRFTVEAGERSGGPALVIRVGASAGNFGGQPQIRRVALRLHAWGVVTSVAVNGIPRAEENLVFDCPTQAETVIVIRFSPVIG